MKNLSAIALLFLAVLFSQDSMGGYPYSFSNNVSNNVGVIITDEVDHDQMFEEDELRPTNSPYRYY